MVGPIAAIPQDLYRGQILQSSTGRRSGAAVEGVRCLMPARSAPARRGKTQARRAALVAVVGMVAFLFNYFGVNMWVVGLHSYAGV